MIIIFEGLDRSGKTTQLTKLAERLEMQKMRVFSFQEPGSTEVGKIIRTEIIKNQSFKLNPISQIYAFALARTELSSYLFSKFTPEELYGSETFILIDRWKASTYAYQGAKLWSPKPYIHNAMLKIINDTNEVASFQIKPNLSLFFDLDLETVKLRLQAESEKDIFSSEKDSFYKRVASLYDRYIFENDKNENFVKINTSNKNIDFIHEEVHNIVAHFSTKLKELSNEQKKEE